jgi:hypothetical protein
MEKETLKEPYVTPEITTEDVLPVAHAGGGCGCYAGSPGTTCGCGS